MTDTVSATAPRTEQKPFKRTTYAVWEITLKCNLACSHCGSRAGDSRSDELSTAEALDLVHQLADIGIEEVSLIGGEAFLRKDWLEIAAEIKRCGMRPAMTTGGFGISERTAEKMAEVGISAVSVSIDGMEEKHDQLRGRKGSFQQAFQTMKHVHKAGIRVGSNVQLNRFSAPVLPLLYEKLREVDFKAWQLQHTVPMGNAADNKEILFQPYELIDLFPLLGHLADRCTEDNVIIQPGNNVGYYGPYERRLRGAWSNSPDAFYRGCPGGLEVLGIEANGAIKACPSLPTVEYTGGNIRDMKLKNIVFDTAPLAINHAKGTPQATDHLWGACKSCEFAELCRGGCNWTAHVFFGKRGNNPFCIQRALKHAGMGIRERLQQEKAAGGQPFDHGLFSIIEEPFDAPLPEDPHAFDLSKVQYPDSWLEADPELPQRLAQERERNLSFYRERYGRETASV